MPTRTALVVDDSKTARVILGSMLERHDLTVDTAETAEQALDYLRHHRPDVIFMDHQMPGMDGLQAVREIKNDPNTAMIPIMMYTAKQGEVYLGEARALGAIGILSKQVRPAEVFNVLRNLGLAEERRAPEEHEGGRRDEAKPRENVDSLTAEPTPEQFAQRTAEYIETKILRAQLPALVDGHLSGIRQEMAKLREEMAHNFERLARPPEARMPEASEPDLSPIIPMVATPSDIPPTSRWPRRLTTALVVTLLAIVAWGGAQFTSAEQTLAHAKQANSSLLSAVEWSLNRAGRFDYDQVPFDDKRLEMLKDLLLQLSWSHFRGTVQISGHVGRYCLEGNSAIGFKLAGPESTPTQCDRIGQPPDVGQAMAEAMSDRFSAYLEYLEGLADVPIRIAITSFGDERPVQAYPDFAEVETAGEWNRIARLNTRLEFKIVRHHLAEASSKNRSGWDLFRK
jgi:CheY-like chemotaxis protein